MILLFCCQNNTTISMTASSHSSASAQQLWATTALLLLSRIDASYLAPQPFGNLATNNRINYRHTTTTPILVPSNKAASPSTSSYLQTMSAHENSLDMFAGRSHAATRLRLGHGGGDDDLQPQRSSFMALSLSAEPLDGETSSEPATDHISSSSSSSSIQPTSLRTRVRNYFQGPQDGLSTKQRLTKMGLAVALSYGWVSNLSYCVSVSLAWYIFNKRVRFILATLFVVVVVYNG